jgi:hypothetical protein
MVRKSQSGPGLSSPTERQAKTAASGLVRAFPVGGDEQATPANKA